MVFVMLEEVGGFWDLCYITVLYVLYIYEYIRETHLFNNGSGHSDTEQSEEWNSLFDPSNFYTHTHHRDCLVPLSIIVT